MAPQKASAPRIAYLSLLNVSAAGPVGVIVSPGEHQAGIGDIKDDNGVWRVISSRAGGDG
jgi:hypothetical protein